MGAVTVPHDGMNTCVLEAGETFARVGVGVFRRTRRMRRGRFGRGCTAEGSIPGAVTTTAVGLVDNFHRRECYWLI